MSIFFEAALTNVFKNEYQAICCCFPKEFKNAVNSQTIEIRKEITEKHNKAVAKWEKGRKIKNTPKIRVMASCTP